DHHGYRLLHYRRLVFAPPPPAMEPDARNPRRLRSDARWQAHRDHSRGRPEKAPARHVLAELQRRTAPARARGKGTRQFDAPESRPLVDPAKPVNGHPTPFSRKMDACRPHKNSTIRISRQPSPSFQAGPLPMASFTANTNSATSCMPSDSWPL